MRSPVIIRIFKGQQLIEVKQFDREQIIFGREADVQVDLKDDSVSQIHCLIELRESGYFICDLGSSTGTYKDGKSVLDESISSGQYFEVGPFRIQFFVGVPKSKDSPQTAATILDPKPRVEAVAPKVAPVSQATVLHQAPPRLPETNVVLKSSVTPAQSGKGKRGRKTFAPDSEIKDLKKHLKVTKGPLIEVIVSWQERILTTYHFSGDKTITVGSDSKSDVKLPGDFLKGTQPFIETKNGTRVLATIEMAPELVNGSQTMMSQEELLKLGKAIRTSSGVAVRVEQGEMAVLSISGGTLMIFVRHVPQSAKPILAAPLALSSGELTGLVIAALVVLLTKLYFTVTQPEEPVAELEQEVVRLAEFIYEKPKTPDVERPEPRPEPENERVETNVPTTTIPVRVQVTDQKKENIQKGNPNSRNMVQQTAAARAQEVRPRPSKVDRPKKFTSTKQGGSVKVGEKEGANAQSKDVNSEGLLAAFGGGGNRKQLDQAYSGPGDLLGMANQATGSAGQSSNRAGEDLGSKFKDTGAGGKGTATQGIAGVGTKGRGAGMNTFGSGTGLGGKGSVTLDVGGSEEGWTGTIDREAVRRVIRSILSQLKSCYERQLRVDSALEGKVVIQFEIAEQGRVRSAMTKSTSLNNTTVESCVAARIREARFPEPPTGTIAVVDYPFVFGAQK